MIVMDSLTTSEIRAGLGQCPITAPHFVGVFSLDNLPQKIFKNPAILVCNSAYSGSKGEHWVAFFVGPKTFEFFDSYGMPPMGEHMTRFITANDPGGRCTYSTAPLQSELATTCGKFAMTYLYNRVLGYSLRQYVELLGNNPDEKVRKLYKKIFGGECGVGSGQKCYKYSGHAVGPCTLK